MKKLTGCRYTLEYKQEAVRLVASGQKSLDMAWYSRSPAPGLIFHGDERAKARATAEYGGFFATLKDDG